MNIIDKRLNKTAWFTDLPTLDPETEVNFWVMPKGSLCRLTKIAGVNVLQNGNSHICSSPIVDMLMEHGLEGDLLIDYVDSIIPTIPRWIRYYMTEKTVDDLINDAAKISITVLGKNPDIKPGLPISVKTIQPMRIKAVDVKDIARNLSRNDQNINFFIIERDEGVCYTYEPNRLIRGIVTGHTEHGYVVSIRGGETVQIVDRVNALSRHLLELTGVSPKDVVGSVVDIEYTSHMDGERLRPYKAPIIVHIPSVRKLAVNGFGFDNTQPIRREDKTFIFEPKRPKIPSVITPSRLTDSITVKDDVGNITFLDRFTEEPVAHLRKGKRIGELCVLARIGNAIEHFTFETVYDSDSLLLSSFNNLVGKLMWCTYGIQFINCGLYHEYEDKPMIGGRRLDYVVEHDQIVDVEITRPVHAF